jgi:tRNA threonylcarbamoyladenosine biosynthesis protein TsaB
LRAGAQRSRETKLPSGSESGFGREDARPGLTLAVETSTPLGGVALGRGETILGEVVIGERTRHAESLLPAVRYLLDHAGSDPSDVRAIVVGAGPGSFTGVRIAAATAKGMAHALDVPLLAYSSLAAAAASAAQAGRAVCALFDARRDEVYAACYRFPEMAGIETVIEPAPRRLEELLEEALPHEPLFAGEGAVLHRATIAAARGTVAPAHLGVPRASSLLWLAHVAPAAGVVEARDWEPAYLRPSGAERRAS